MTSFARGSVRRPRLAYVVTSAQTAATFLPGLLRTLQESGFDVTVITAPDADLPDAMSAAGVAYAPVAMRRDPSPVRDLASLLALIRTLHRTRPDMVVYATPKASLLASAASRLLGIRVRVYEQWGLRLETAHGPSRWILWVLERLTISSSTDVIANSASLIRRLHELHLDPAQRARGILSGSSHGVDLEVFSPDKAPESTPPALQGFLAEHPGLTVGFVGRVHPDKGIATLLDALDICTARGTLVKGVIVGQNEGFPLPAGATRGGTPLFVPGPQTDLRPYYAAFDILVLMSEREGFPNVVLEAAAMGVPSIVSDATGTVDSVHDGVTGHISPVSDPEALARRIEGLAGDSDARARLGRAARTRVEEEFDSRKIQRARALEYLARLQDSREAPAPRKRVKDSRHRQVLQPAPQTRPPAP